MRRAAVIGIVVAAALVVAAGAVGAWVLTRPPSAEAVADDYLRALSKGDLAGIESVVVDGHSRQLDQVGAAFAGAQGYISHYSVELGDERHGQRKAHANAELGGKSTGVDFTLTRQDGRWRVSDYLGSLEAHTTIGDSVRVGGVLTGADQLIPLLPAVYPVAAAPSGLLYGKATAVVTTEAPVVVAIAASVSPDAGERAQQQLDLYADACAKPAHAVPPQCGLRVPWAADLASLASIAFRIDAYPVVQLSADGRAFDAVGGQIVATATGQTREGAPGTFTYRADDWALRGSVEFTGDEMVLAVR